MSDTPRPRRRGASRNGDEPLRIGARASHAQMRLCRYRIGAVPLLNHFFHRLKLPEVLRRELPGDDPRCLVASERVVLLLVRNVLISREPMYGIPQWAAQYSPELFDLYHDDIQRLHDDRLGDCLARLFTNTTPQLLLSIVRSAIDNFDLALDEIHNDSTSIAFHGDYFAARRPSAKAGRVVPAITWGHSKDHRPDLKQLLFTLTLSNDGGVPLYFQVDSGNTNDDVTHRGTWDLLVELVGRPDFLYVADCKLASSENLAYIAVRGGRFITVLPRSRREDADFRQLLRSQPEAVVWKNCWTRVEEPSDPERPLTTEQAPDDVFRVCCQEYVTSSGYRLLWFHSLRKAQHDEAARAQRCQRAIQDLEELQRRLTLPRTRFRRRAQVEEAVQQVLAKRNMESLLNVEIIEREEEAYYQTSRGRPSPNSTYRREVTRRFDMTWSIDQRRWREAQVDDGMFPLITNDRALTPRQVLEAYKRQPKIEKRFAQLKSDFDVAPVLLKNPERVVGLFTIYFLALLVQSLIERELRRALDRAAQRTTPERRRHEGSIDIYPEWRRTRRPTARFVLDALEGFHRSDLLGGEQSDDDEPLMLYDELTPMQARLLTLLGMNPATYGR